MNKSLPWPHNRTLESAEGWLQLGVPWEAWEELRQLPLQWKRHPDALEIQWQLYAMEYDWNAALEVGKLLQHAAPKRPSGWLHHAYALRRSDEGGLQAAWEALLPAWTKFPNEPVIPYNLACYACQQGRLEEAMQWISKTMKCGDTKAIKKMALQDEDLEPLREKIGRL